MRIRPKGAAPALPFLDILAAGALGGIGFTVSLLIGELAFGGSSEADDHVKVAVLAGSVAAALIAAVLLRVRNRHYRQLWEDGDDRFGVVEGYRGAVSRLPAPPLPNATLRPRPNPGV